MIEDDFLQEASLPDEKPDEPVYISSLEIENVRCFGRRQTFSLANENETPIRWNIVLGDNGVGKTTLLQCLAWMRPVPVSEKSHEKLISYEPALSSEENSVLDSLVRVGSNVEVELCATFSVGAVLGGSSPVSGNVPIRTKFHMRGENGKFVQSDPNPRQGEGELSAPPRKPPIFGYGANRCPGTLKLERGRLGDPLASLFENAAELYDSEDILLKFDHRAAKSACNEDKHRLERIKDVVSSVLPDVENADDIEILGPEIIGQASEPSGVLLRTPYGSVPLQRLSRGCRTTLTWILDLAMRLHEFYPSRSDPLSEPSIVIVDNIDLHLHPKWQRRLMEDLSRCFPATQFIVSTHSPLVAQAAENENLVVLRRQSGEVLVESRDESVGEMARRSNFV